MIVTNAAGLASDELTRIERELEGHSSLSEVLNWGERQPPGALLPQVIADVVVQDEFTHDVIVPWRDGLVLVYDTT